MPTDCISYQSSGYFSKLITDYLDENAKLKPFYNRFPTLENFKDQIEDRRTHFDDEQRKILVDTLRRQYQNVETSKATEANFRLLEKSNTFTVTTGHQLNLFTGPLYFLYKIVSTINLSKQLQNHYPENNFIPIYWMATEDHDFEEINYFNFKGKKFRWNKESAGAVGRLDTAGLDEVFRLFSLELGSGKNAETIKKLFSKAYLKHATLTEATRNLANELFSEYGLVILDADDSNLKRTFIPYMKRDLLEQLPFKSVSETIEHLSEYPIQVNPREINLFYLDENLRERILFQDDIFYVNNTDIKFTKAELLSELDNYPEKFSPNVIMRPLYQEVILPNLCYIGGGGEIAYWLELKSFFDVMNVPVPILLVRNSVLIATEKQAKKADALDLSWTDLFSKQSDLVNTKINTLSEFPLDLSRQKNVLRKQFDDLYEISNQTDKSFSGAVKAQEAKQIKGLDNLEKRLLRAQKRKHEEQLSRITDLQNELFPFRSLQERQTNFAEFYLETGETLIPKLISLLKPLENEFSILIL